MPNDYLEQPSALKQIGITLREAREAKGIALEVAEEETKIRKYYLEALENGNREQLPGDVYLKGFLKNYATFLDLPGLELVDKYKREPVPVTHSDEKNNTGAHLHSSRLLSNKIWTLLLLGIVLTAAIGIKYRQGMRTDPSSTLPGHFEADHVLNDAEVTDDSIVPDTLVEVVAETASEIAYAVSSESIIVELEVTDDRCWISLRIDDLPETSDTMLPGSTRTISAAEKIRFRAGNPGVLKLTINGVPFKTVGSKDQPRNVVIELLSDNGKTS